MSDSAMSINKLGTKEWRRSDGQLHRLDGPSSVWANGDKCWYQNGQLHRINGPASEYSDGYKSWWVNGAYLGSNVEGFWKLWDRLTEEQKQDPVLLTYLPEKF